MEGFHDNFVRERSECWVRCNEIFVLGFCYIESSVYTYFIEITILKN